MCAQRREVPGEEKGCDGGVGGEGDAGERSGREDLAYQRGERGCGGRVWRLRAEKYILWPVAEEYGSVDAGGCAGQGELADSNCAVGGGAVS